jgi:hypothetical protein
MAELAVPSIEMFEHFDEIIGIPGYSISIKQQGYLFLTDNPETVDDLKENVKQQHKLGVTDSEFIERDEIIARFPHISPSVLAATFRQPDMNTSAGHYVYTPDDQPAPGNSRILRQLRLLGRGHAFPGSRQTHRRSRDREVGSKRQPLAADTFQRRPWEKG